MHTGNNNHRLSTAAMLNMTYADLVLFSSPVATGFLSGKLTSGNAQDTRFGGDGKTATALKAQYDKKEFHDAIHSLNAILQPAGISSIEAALRWISFHSCLTPEDGIILGATKAHYIVENAKSIQKGPLPQDIVNVIEKLGDVVSQR